MSTVNRSKPTITPVVAGHLPGELRATPQWVVYRLTRRDYCWAKVPFDAVTMRPARTNDPRMWRTFALALRRHSAGAADGVGFVFSRNDPYVGIDLDGCRDPATGRIAAWAAAILRELNSYSEVSPSGTGVKVIARGALPCAGTGRRRQLRDVAANGERRAEIEMYRFGRFFALTGLRLARLSPRIEDRGAELIALWNRVFGRPVRKQSPADARTPRPIRGRARSDMALLRRARSARNGTRFSRLFDAGRLDEYGGDHSRADLALCNMLAFWARGDAAQIDRLFRRSALMRPKWDERHSSDGAAYGAMTIWKALTGGRGAPAGRRAADSGRTSAPPR